MGGVRVRAEAGEFWALFDNPRQAVQFDNGEVMDAGPQLQIVSSDVDRYSLRRGSLLRLPAGAFRVLDLAPDGNGLTVVRLEVP